jgi:hypothetical protein
MSNSIKYVIPLTKQIDYEIKNQFNWTGPITNGHAWEKGGISIFFNVENYNFIYDYSSEQINKKKNMVCLNAYTFKDCISMIYGNDDDHEEEKFMFRGEAIGILLHDAENSDIINDSIASIMPYDGLYFIQIDSEGSRYISWVNASFEDIQKELNDVDQYVKSQGVTLKEDEEELEEEEEEEERPKEINTTKACICHLGL